MTARQHLASMIAVASIALAAIGCVLDRNSVAGNDDGTGGAGVATTAHSSSVAQTGVSSTSISTGSGAPGGTSSSSASATVTVASSSHVASSSSTGGLPNLQCGDAPCAPGQVCCHNGSSPNYDYCDAPGQCGQDYEIACAGPADCPGKTCCGQLDGDNEWIGASCVNDCYDYPLCSGGGSCPLGWTCTQSTQLGSFYWYCEPPA